jgi:hypothetical protein
MAKRPSIFKDLDELSAAIAKHCVGFSDKDKDEVRAAALLDSSCSKDSMDEIVQRILLASFQRGSQAIPTPAFDDSAPLPVRAIEPPPLFPGWKGREKPGIVFVPVDAESAEVLKNLSPETRRALNRVAEVGLKQYGREKP